MSSLQDSPTSQVTVTKEESSRQVITYVKQVMSQVRHDIQYMYIYTLATWFQNQTVLFAVFLNKDIHLKLSLKGALNVLIIGTFVLVCM